VPALQVQADDQGERIDDRDPLEDRLDPRPPAGFEAVPAIDLAGRSLDPASRGQR
jgi:hypothetical protein